MKMSTKFKIAALAVLAAAGLALANDIQVTGAGATFPYPIYGKWFQEFRNVRKDVQINYQAKGSSTGIQMLTEGTVDFGASDKPMSDKELAAVKVPTLHFPTVLGAVVPIFHIPGYDKELKLTGDVIGDIYAGKITNWDDKRLSADNPGLPNHSIVVVHRADGSGTSFVFTDYLSKVSSEWKGKAAAQPNWPVGVGGKNNDGVAGLVKQTPFSIGYVEMIYALQNHISMAAVKNEAGHFVHGEFANVSAAAAGVSMPKDFRVSITNASGKDAYPISTFTWLLIPSKIDDAGKRGAIVDFLKWMVSDGQKYTKDLGYAPLPPAVAAKVKDAISLVK
jgi:phosphate transport system substrate-binding protein